MLTILLAALTHPVRLARATAQVWRIQHEEMMSLARIDLNAARRERAPRAPHEVVVGDPEEVFYVPDARTWDMDALEALMGGRLAVAMRMVMGAEEYERFRKHTPDMDDAKLIFDTVAEAAELGSLGNSSASTTSPASTGDS